MLTRTEWEELKYWSKKEYEKARRNGIIPKLKKGTQCHYCDNEAIGYDHRDYRKPLEVVPVCRSCNRTLPSALPEFVNDFESRAQIELSTHGEEIASFNGSFIGNIDLRFIEDHLEYCAYYPYSAYQQENHKWDWNRN